MNTDLLTNILSWGGCGLLRSQASLRQEGAGLLDRFGVRADVDRVGYHDAFLRARRDEPMSLSILLMYARAI